MQASFTNYHQRHSSYSRKVRHSHHGSHRFGFTLARRWLIKNITNTRLLSSILLFGFVLLGMLSTVYLVSLNQDIRQQASDNIYCGGDGQIRCADVNGNIPRNGLVGEDAGCDEDFIAVGSGCTDPHRGEVEITAADGTIVKTSSTNSNTVCLSDVCATSIGSRIPDDYKVGANPALDELFREKLGRDPMPGEIISDLLGGYATTSLPASMVVEKGTTNLKPEAVALLDISRGNEEAHCNGSTCTIGDFVLPRPVAIAHDGRDVANKILYIDEQIEKGEIHLSPAEINFNLAFLGPANDFFGSFAVDDKGVFSVAGSKEQIEGDSLFCKAFSDSCVKTGQTSTSNQAVSVLSVGESCQQGQRNCPNDSVCDVTQHKCLVVEGGACQDSVDCGSGVCNQGLCEAKPVVLTRPDGSSYGSVNCAGGQTAVPGSCAVRANTDNICVNGVWVAKQGGEKCLGEVVAPTAQITLATNQLAETQTETQMEDESLSEKEKRDLTQRCVFGIDVAEKRCLPAPATFNEQMNLGNGSSCTLDVQCNSGSCSEGVCVKKTNPEESTSQEGKGLLYRVLGPVYINMTELVPVKIAGSTYNTLIEQISDITAKILNNAITTTCGTFGLTVTTGGCSLLTNAINPAESSEPLFRNMEVPDEIIPVDSNSPLYHPYGPYGDLFVEYCGDLAWLCAAHAYHESRWNPDSIRMYGGIIESAGITQIVVRPDDCDDAIECGYRFVRPTADQTLDPEFSIQWTRDKIFALLDQCQGDAVCALAAYNGGNNPDEIAYSWANQIVYDGTILLRNYQATQEGGLADFATDLLYEQQEPAGQVFELVYPEQTSTTAAFAQYLQEEYPDGLPSTIILPSGMTNEQIRLSLEIAGYDVKTAEEIKDLKLPSTAYAKIPVENYLK